MINSVKRIIVFAHYKGVRFIEGQGMVVHGVLAELHNEHVGTHDEAEHRTHERCMEKEKFSHQICHELKRILELSPSHTEVILVAEPKMLGLLREDMEKELAHVTVYKALHVDPARLSLKDIEAKIFE